MSERFSVRSRIHSMRFACNGLKILWREQHNARVHLCAAIAVVVAGLLLKLSAIQWVILLLLIAIVWIAEALNSAVEYLCDRVTTEQDPLIAKAKDVAAAGVLLASVIAAAGGMILFGSVVFS